MIICIYTLSHLKHTWNDIICPFISGGFESSKIDVSNKKNSVVQGR